MKASPFPPESIETANQWFHSFPSACFTEGSGCQSVEKTRFVASMGAEKSMVTFLAVISPDLRRLTSGSILSHLLVLRKAPGANQWKKQDLLHLWGLKNLW